MARSLSIDGTLITDESDCYVIAEIGHNHQGSVEKCRELFRAAKECGADAVKLQKRDNRTLYTRAMYERPYDNENSFGPTYGAHREALEFGRAEYLELQQYAAELGITFFATAFDFSSADFLAQLDMPAYKLASGDLRNIPLIRHVARIGKPMILSTGGATPRRCPPRGGRRRRGQSAARHPAVHRHVPHRAGADEPAGDRHVARGVSRGGGGPVRPLQRHRHGGGGVRPGRAGSSRSISR